MNNQAKLQERAQQEAGPFANNEGDRQGNENDGQNRLQTESYRSLKSTSSKKRKTVLRAVELEEHEGPSDLQKQYDRYEKIRLEWNKHESKPNYNYMKEIIKIMTSTGIPCKKYNYSLDKDAQTLASQNAIIKLSADQEMLIIMNEKPVLK